MSNRRTSLSLLLALLTACTDGDDSAEAPEPFLGTSESEVPSAAEISPGNSNADTNLGNEASAGDNPLLAGSTQEPELPPEVEFETSFRAPVVTGQLIWATNPRSGRVALVDALSREVQTLAAGLEPTYLTAVGAELQVGALRNRALVINAGSNDATLFREGAEGDLVMLDLPLHRGATAWAVSAGGRWAVAWSDERAFSGLDPTEGLQDISVIDLTEEVPEPLRFSVGYRPVQLTFDAAETRLYAVTQDGISVLSLEGDPQLLEDINLGDSAVEVDGTAGQPVLQDVPVTEDGQFAVVRYAGASRVEVVSLRDNERRALALPGEASDVDLVPGGGAAVAVIRQTGQVVTFDVREAYEQGVTSAPLSFGEAALGSVAVAEGGNKALLFTNAVDSDLLTILDLQDESFRSLSLKAPISAVFPSPEGSHAVALLKTEPGSDRRGAFSVVPVSEALPAKIQGTQAPPYRVTIAETQVGLRSLLATRDDSTGIYAVYLVRMPSLQVDRIELNSPPIAVGLLPEHGVGYVAQQHPEGRITFIDLQTARPETLTGFELAGRIVDGASQ